MNNASTDTKKLRPCRKCKTPVMAESRGRPPYCATCRADVEAARIAAMGPPTHRTSHLCVGGCGSAVRAIGTQGRQGCCQACKPTVMAKRREGYRKARELHLEINPAVAVAQRAIRDEIRHGRIPPAADLPCAGKGLLRGDCGGKHAYHHPDYTRPLFVVALCARHHIVAHWTFATRGLLTECAAAGCDVLFDGPRQWFCPEHGRGFPPVKYWPEAN